MNKNILKNILLGLGTLALSSIYNSAEAQTTVRLTQSADTSTFQTSYISCGSAGLYTAENNYLRKYDLATYANQFNNEPLFKVTGIRFGVLLNDVGSTIYVKLYRFNGGAFTMANCTLIDTDTLTLSFVNQQRMTANVEGVFQRNDVIVAEINAPSGLSNYNIFAMGSNLAGQTDTSYIYTSECGITTPTNLSQLVAGADMHLMLDVLGFGGDIPAQPSPYTQVADTICKGMQNVVYTVPPVAGATSYVWEYTGTGAFINPNGNTANVSFSTNATGGTLKVKAVNAFGESPSRDVLIVANNQFSLQITPSSPEICKGDSVTLEAIYPSNSYNWQPPTGLNNINSRIVKASPTNSNYYTVTVVDSASGCIGTGYVYVKVNQPPVIQTNPANLVVCNGDSLNVSLSGGDRYKWIPNTYLNNDSSANIKMYPDRNTSYVIQSTSAEGCMSEKTVNVIKNGVLAPPVNQNGNILSVPNNYASYQWYQDNTVIIPIANTHQFGIKMKGKYKCLVTDANGCSGFSEEIDITPTNINGLSKDLFNIYPNPAQDQITIESNLDLATEIYSLEGKRIMIANEKTIDISTLNQGLYILKVTEIKTGNQATIKLVKQ